MSATSDYEYEFECTFICGQGLEPANCIWYLNNHKNKIQNTFEKRLPKRLPNSLTNKNDLKSGEHDQECCCKLVVTPEEITRELERRPHNAVVVVQRQDLNRIELVRAVLKQNADVGILNACKDFELRSCFYVSVHSNLQQKLWITSAYSPGGQCEEQKSSRNLGSSPFLVNIEISKHSPKRQDRLHISRDITSMAFFWLWSNGDVFKNVEWAYKDT